MSGRRCAADAISSLLSSIMPPNGHNTGLLAIFGCNSATNATGTFTRILCCIMLQGRGLLMTTGIWDPVPDIRIMREGKRSGG